MTTELPPVVREAAKAVEGKPCILCGETADDGFGVYTHPDLGTRVIVYPVHSTCITREGAADLAEEILIFRTIKDSE